MAKKRQAVGQTNGTITEINGHANGSATKDTALPAEKEATDLTRWRLLDERGRQTWHYLETDEEVKKWPQSVADRYFLGLPTSLPELPKAKTPLQAVDNGLSFISKLQLPPGNWACEYGGPMFLLPGFICFWHATNTPIPEHNKIEIKRYLFNYQDKEDGGWGLHVEGESTAYGTVMTYTALRLMGVDAEDQRMVKARGLIHKLGGATNCPHWGKFWLSVLGVMEWEGVNPLPPELWLLPDFTPFAPWRWWIHIRQVFLPMSYIYSRRFVCPQSPIIFQLREEVYTRPHSEIHFNSHRNDVSPRDNYHPKPWILVALFWVLANIWFPFLRPRLIKWWAERWTFRLIQYEDANTDYAGLAPISNSLNALACYIHDGPTSDSFLTHLDRLRNYLWMTPSGLLCNGTDGVQTWDTSWLIQAVHAANLTNSKKWRPMLLSALEFLEDQQIRENCVDQRRCYRQQRKGAWAFSTKKQGYTVSDCTSEALKAVLMLQNDESADFPKLVDDGRIMDAIDTLLTMQNPSGGFASYEPQRAGEWMENLNAAEVFGRIMVEYDYPECSTAVVTALHVFTQHNSWYRKGDIAKAVGSAGRYIRNAQREDGSWYGSWGICFTYAGMFALESLASVNQTYGNSAFAKKGCEFLLSKQRDDGGWGESYKSCETGWYSQRESQVVMTAWACIGLMNAGFPDRGPIERGIRLLMERQQANGEWLQEGIEGVFNKSVVISFPNYKFAFPIKALGMFAEQYGDVELQ